MSQQIRRFPPDVARSLQEPEGAVTVHYTHPGPLEGPPPMDRMLMQTPYEEVLAALVLDTKLNLRFIRTGSRREGARVALVNLSPFVRGGRHWLIGMAWSLDEMSVSVRDLDSSGGRALEGRWPPQY